MRLFNEKKQSINSNFSIAANNRQILLLCKLDSFKIYRGFHSSVCMLSDKELENRFNKLKEAESINSEAGVGDISLNNKTAEEMKLSLLNFKNEISNKEVSDEFNKVSDYFKPISDNDNNYSSFQEAFPNYVKNQSKASEVKAEEENVFYVVKEVANFFEECKSKGVKLESCIDQLKLSNIVEKVKPSSDKSDDLKQKVGTEIMKDLSILDEVGNITLSDLYTKSKELKEKFNITINPNYAEIGLSLVSYGLLMKSYSKYIDTRPLPKNLSAEDLKVIRSSRAFSRY